MRASVSKIKQFYNFTEGLYGITHNDVCDTIKGVKTDSFQKNVGTLADAYIMDYLAQDLLLQKEYDKLCEELNLTLSNKSLKVLDEWSLNFIKENPILTTQSAGTKDYETSKGTLRVSFRTDIVIPNRVLDIKTSAYHLDPQKYLKDVQGAFYTNALECDTITYEHFWVSPSTHEISYDGAISQPYSTDEYILGILNEFMGFCHQNDLIKHLISKQ